MLGVLIEAICALFRRRSTTSPLPPATRSRPPAANQRLGPPVKAKGTGFRAGELRERHRRGIR